MVQRIMNTVEKTSTGVSPAELILNNSIRLTERIILPPTQAKSSGQFALSDTMDEWVAGQSTLVRVGRDKQLQTDFVNSYVLSITSKSSLLSRSSATAAIATRDRPWSSKFAGLASANHTILGNLTRPSCT